MTIMAWIGLDDTDHLDGGCTTKNFDNLLVELEKNYILEQPRLVRLWPFAKQRTRGNAALTVEINCNNHDELIKILDDWWHSQLLPLKGKISESKISTRKQFPADPGLVYFFEKPNEEFYYSAVSREVSLTEAPTADYSWGGNGIIGATAAVCWPMKNHTYEAISWRIPHNVGKKIPRVIDLEMAKNLDEDYDTFMSRDPRSDNLMIAPRGDCPVLFGLRAKLEQNARNACEALLKSPKTEQTSGYRVFVTNQATDDHLDEDKQSIVKSLTIKSRGTVIIETESDKLIAFAESGDLKNLAQWLKVGDLIQFNGLKALDNTVHLERLMVIEAVPNLTRPSCLKCDRKMKSIGRSQGLKCPICKATCEDRWDETPRVPPFNNWVQPPLDSMRHLAKPTDWN